VHSQNAQRPAADPGPRKPLASSNPPSLIRPPKNPDSPSVTPRATSSPDTLRSPITHAGLIALVGRTNVGKSSLVNALVGSKVSIVTPKPQTTRHPIHGIVNRGHAQFVFVDTPGFFRTRRSRLVDRLHERARTALEGIDAVLHVVDPSRPIGAEDEWVVEALAAVSQPRILCINKSDLNRRPHRDEWMARSSGYAGVIETSAQSRSGLFELFAALQACLPEGPPLYGLDETTNTHRDFRLSEVIREKVYLLTQAEVPYRTGIELDLVEERTGHGGKTFTHIKAAILVSAERYKGMLVGAQGQMIRAIGTAARRDLETILGGQVFLDLAVLVDPSLDL